MIYVAQLVVPAIIWAFTIFWGVVLWHLTFE